MKSLTSTTKSELKKEVKILQKFLRNKVLSKIYRHRAKEIGIEFKDGTRLFVDHVKDGFEFSIQEFRAMKIKPTVASHKRK